MRKMLYGITTAMLFFSCTDFTDQYHYYVAPELRPFVDEFYSDAKSRGYDLPTDELSVRLATPSGHTGENAGESVLGSMMIVIDPVFVLRNLDGYKQDSLIVKWVVYHELGHGVLCENHRGGESIMNARNEHILLFSTDPSAEKRMIDELFAESGFRHK